MAVGQLLAGNAATALTGEVSSPSLGLEGTRHTALDLFA